MPEMTTTDYTIVFVIFPADTCSSNTKKHERARGRPGNKKLAKRISLMLVFRRELYEIKPRRGIDVSHLRVASICRATGNRDHHRHPSLSQSWTTDGIRSTCLMSKIVGVHVILACPLMMCPRRPRQ